MGRYETSLIFCLRYRKIRLRCKIKIYRFFFFFFNNFVLYISLSRKSRAFPSSAACYNQLASRYLPARNCTDCRCLRYTLAFEGCNPRSFFLYTPRKLSFSLSFVKGWDPQQAVMCSEILLRFLSSFLNFGFFLYRDALLHVLHKIALCVSELQKKCLSTRLTHFIYVPSFSVILLNVSSYYNGRFHAEK